MTETVEIPDKFHEMARVCAEYYRTRGRRFPWRETCDPYPVLVAEFLLRKTQAFRVLPVFLDLMEMYPTLDALSKAKPNKVRCIVAPLGLPLRGPQLVNIAHTLHKSGQRIESGQALRKFKGIGLYIANAVDCLAFQRPTPMIDGAVGRLLRRVMGFPNDKAAYLEKSIWILGQSILQASLESSKEVSLGLLDIAAEKCRVKKPLCPDCPLGNLCSSGKCI